MLGNPVKETFVLLVILTLFVLPMFFVNQGPVNISQSEESVAEESGYHTHRADVILRAAHPFTEVAVTVNGEILTFSQDEIEKEIDLIFQDELVTMNVQVKWPEGTPETALFIRIVPDGLPEKNVTIWGEGMAFEELIFQWEDINGK